MWAMPCYGPIDPDVYQSHMVAMGSCTKLGIKVFPKMVGITDKMGLASASNHLVECALQLGVDYVFWTEMDMDVPVDAIPKLYDRHKEIVGGLYFLRESEGNEQPCAYMASPENVATSEYSHMPVGLLKNDQLYKVHCIGMGCVLFKTSVFKKIEKPWFQTLEGKCGQDIYFYTKLRQAGVPVYLDTSVHADQWSKKQRIGFDQYKKLLETGELQRTGFVLGAETPVAA